MRLEEHKQVITGYRIFILDDDQGIIDTLSVLLRRRGYDFVGMTDPLAAIEEIRAGGFDLLILDYIMENIRGDKVVQRIREFNQDLYILLLTGHKDIAPPLETLRALEIQAYCEKSDKFDQLLLLVESGIKSVSQMRMIKKFRDGLNKILESIPKIYQLQPIVNILDDILIGLMKLIEGKNGFILVDDNIGLESKDNRSIFSGIGKYNVPVEKFLQMLDPHLMELIGYARTVKKPEHLENAVIFPLVNELDQSIGVIYVEGQSLDDGVKLIEIYANHAASSLSNAFLHSLVHVKNDELHRTYDELKTRYMDTIEALRLTVDARDVYTSGHSDRVSSLSVKIGKRFGLSENDLETLRVAGIFHDVGKIGTADDILLKTDPLDSFEFEAIKKHPLVGAHILSAIAMFGNVVPLVRCHHERIDGQGYPDGLRDGEIPFMAKIIAVVDAFDAMTSDRQYRQKLSYAEAKEQLQANAGTQFDAAVVAQMIDLLENEDREAIFK